MFASLIHLCKLRLDKAPWWLPRYPNSTPPLRKVDAGTQAAFNMQALLLTFSPASFYISPLLVLFPLVYQGP